MLLPKSTARFRIEARVGGGAMGDIFRAKDKQSGDTVAVKLLRQRPDATARARFRREAEVLAELRHPGVVGYVDHGTWSDGRAFLAMEWLEGEDLQARSRREPLGMKSAVEVVRRAAAALAAVHSRGVVHRDLKLSNLWLVTGKSLNVKLIDFGVVKPSDPDGFETERGTIIGTPHYMAPEQVRGEPVTPRADVYSLGAVLFRLVTGRVIFPTEHVVALLGQLVNDDPPLASSVRLDVPEALDQVITACIARKASDRYADAGELSRALARVGVVPIEAPGREGSSSTVRRVPVATFVDDPSRTSPGTTIERDREIRVVTAVVAAAEDDEALLAARSAAKKHLAAEDSIDVLPGRRLVLVFGAHGSRSGGDPVRAARAALALVAESEKARAAIAVGRAVAGTSREALELAAAELDKTANGAVRVDASAVALLSDYFVLRERDGAVSLLYEGEKSDSARRLLGKATPTVGRDKEIGLLLGVYREMLEDSAPRVAVVSGPPGIGKSRLRWEVNRRLALEEVRPEMFLCRGDPDVRGGGTPAIGRVLRDRVGVTKSQGVESQLEKVSAYAPSLYAEEAKALLDLSRTGADRRGRGPDARRAAVAALRDRGARSPLVLVLEDLHWMDETTTDIVDALLGERKLPLLVLGFGRADQGPTKTVFSDRGATRFELGPLSFGAVSKLVAQVSPGLGEDARASLIERAGGNALFLEELLRAAAERAEGLPITVAALVQARLDQLAPAVRKVARAASVFGRTTWTEGLRALLDADPTEDLAALTSFEILAPSDGSRFLGEDEWTFGHALVRDAIYETIEEQERAAWHRRAASWLEAAGEEDLAVVARHADKGGDARAAASFFARAAEGASLAGRIGDAAALAREGLRLGASGGVAARLSVVAGAAALLAGSLGDAATFARDATAAAPDAADGRVLLAQVFAATGQLDEALGLLPPGGAGEETAAPVRVLLLAALERRNDATATFDATPSRPRAGNGATLFAMAKAAVSSSHGHPADAVAILDAATPELVRTSAGVALFARLALAGHALQAYDFARAVDVSQAVADDARGSGAQLAVALADLVRAEAALLRDGTPPTDRAALARTWLASCGHASASRGFSVSAISLARAGDFKSALLHAKDASALARTPADRRLAQRALAWVHLSRGAVDAALELSLDDSYAVEDPWVHLAALVRVRALMLSGEGDEAALQLARLDPSRFGATTVFGRALAG